MYVDFEICFGLCAGVTIGDGEVIFNGGDFGFYYPGVYPGMGISSVPISEQGSAGVSCGAGAGHGAEVTVGDTANPDDDWPYVAGAYSPGTGAFCGPEFYKTAGD